LQPSHGSALQRNLARVEDLSDGIFERTCSIVGLYSKSAEFVAPRTGEVQHSCLAIAKAKLELGWSPRTTLESGLTQTILRS
jgi:dTDP-D-glucose 4,6-dehydratase